MIDNFLRQEFNNKELIVVINKDSINIDNIYEYINKPSKPKARPPLNKLKPLCNLKAPGNIAGMANPKKILNIIA